MAKKQPEQVKQNLRSGMVMTSVVDGVKVKSVTPTSDVLGNGNTPSKPLDEKLIVPNPKQPETIQTVRLKPGSIPHPRKTLEAIGTITELHRKNFADDKTFFRAQFLDVTVACILSDIIFFIEREISTSEIKTPAIVTCTTSTEAEDRRLKRISASHREGRAFDMRSIVFSPSGRAKLMKYVSESYGHLGAISSSTGTRNVILHKNSGYGWHFHIQFDKNFLVEGLVGKDLDGEFEKFKASGKSLPEAWVLSADVKKKGVFGRS